MRTVDPIHVPHSTLVSDLSAFLATGEWTDIVFNVEGEKIYAHKAILCARSETFRLMFRSQMKEALHGEVRSTGVVAMCTHTR